MSRLLSTEPHNVKRRQRASAKRTRAFWALMARLNMTATPSNFMPGGWR